jgi:hypothetical protein
MRGQTRMAPRLMAIRRRDVPGTTMLLHQAV